MEKDTPITRKEFNNLRERVEVLEEELLNTGVPRGSDTDWNTYLEEKKPKNDYERIALIVGHLSEKRKNGVTKEEIIAFIRKNPSDFSNTKNIQAIITGTKTNRAYGYIECANGGKKGEKKYILSIHGAQHIKKMPTDRSGNKSK